MAGFDATFCAPKSVSLLFALGDPETSNEVRNAHDVAVTAALSVLEAEAARGRRGKTGVQRVAAEGFVAAAFRHRTSRAGDPHLHTHVLVANLVNAVTDGRWSALDARPLYAWAKTVGYLYEAQLRAEVTRRLGVEWGPVSKGIADVKGIPRTTLREFSRRREEIETHMAERGQTSARAAQVATYATRSPKDREAAPEGLVPEWRARAEDLGLDDAALVGLVGRVGPPRPPTPAEVRTVKCEQVAVGRVRKLSATQGGDWSAPSCTEPVKDRTVRPGDDLTHPPVAIPTENHVAVTEAPAAPSGTQPTLPTSRRSLVVSGVRGGPGRPARSVTGRTPPASRPARRRNSGTNWGNSFATGGRWRLSWARPVAAGRPLQPKLQPNGTQLTVTERYGKERR